MMNRCFDVYNQLSTYGVVRIRPARVRERRVNDACKDKRLVAHLLVVQEAGVGDGKVTVTLLDFRIEAGRHTHPGPRDVRAK